MTLATLLVHNVDLGVIDRAHGYERLVSLEQDNANFLEASVRGSELYDVLLTIADDQIDCSCTCPYFTGLSGICKHIWATLVAADNTSFARNVKKLGITDLVEVYDDDEEENDDWDEDDDEETIVQFDAPTRYRVKPNPRPALPPPPPPLPPPPAKPVWESELARIRSRLSVQPIRKSNEDSKIVFVIDGPESQMREQLVIEVNISTKKQNGEWAVPRSHTVDTHMIPHLKEDVDRTMLGMMMGSKPISSYMSTYATSQTARQMVPEHLVAAMLPILARKEDVFFRERDKGNLVPVTYDPGPPWELKLTLQPQSKADHWRLSGLFVREGEQLLVQSPSLIVPGMIVINGKYSHYRAERSFEWVKLSKSNQVHSIATDQVASLLSQLYDLPNLPKLALPEQFQYDEVTIAPKPRIVISKVKDYSRDFLIGTMSFDYEGEIVPQMPQTRGIHQFDRKRLILRDSQAESNFANSLYRVGFRQQHIYLSGRSAQHQVIKPDKLAKAVRSLIAEDWHVEAEGKLYKQPGEFKMSVSSGVDWFDLSAQADFEGQLVALPKLLEALKRGENSIVLDDGNLGMIPEDWLKKYGIFANVGKVEGDTVRFRNTQVGLLDALLASRPEVDFDKQFVKARDQLKKFEGVTAVDPPKAFQGELREYQREGLGWLQFLRKFGFGGCLADDMGLGKTVQILALLAAKKSDQTLIVVPKSLIFNWIAEAGKFAPKLKVLNHTGIERQKTNEHFQEYDIILTTYGTLRIDATIITEYQFDTCILDESQAAKNADTGTSKAVRLIQANHRLALSGTPIENHLGELWTLFEFLNPGMLGTASLFASAGAARNPPPETRELLAKALKPFILRRTKEQVAKDLPEKTEQTVYCDLEPEQRKLYNELKEHYRRSLLDKIDTLGLKRSKIQILEALLRLRQASCHPGLIDKQRGAEDCAKLDFLIPRLKEIAEEGHKTLVFSQFTSFLTLVKQRLNQEKLNYVYLDGKTNNRAQVVEQFQNDPAIQVFLISLKAGGVGLNLTAAEYIFILDPWWNPAAEAQAIDRSHRIGQTKPVFAYRLIARDTVEEKVLALQECKRELASAILGNEGTIITELKREDLEMLLS